MLSLMMLIMGLAPILAPLLGSALLTFGGWRLNFWFMTAFGVAVGLAGLLRMKESRSEATAIQASKENPFQSYWTVLRQRRLIGYALAGALNGATLFTYLSTSPGLLMGTYGMSVACFPGLRAERRRHHRRQPGEPLHPARMTPDQVLARSSLVALGVGVLIAWPPSTASAARGRSCRCCSCCWPATASCRATPWPAPSTSTRSGRRHLGADGDGRPSAPARWPRCWRRAARRHAAGRWRRSC
jgi:DHA1 family bicyclomycin/chloramphenicol resistance-like MFS transporter